MSKMHDESPIIDPEPPFPRDPKVSYSVWRNDDGSLNPNTIQMGILGMAAVLAVFMYVAWATMPDTTSPEKILSSLTREVPAQSFLVSHTCEIEELGEQVCVVIFKDPDTKCQFLLTDNWRSTATLTPRTGTSCFPELAEPAVEPVLQPTNPADPRYEKQVQKLIQAAKDVAENKRLLQEAQEHAAQVAEESQTRTTEEITDSIVEKLDRMGDRIVQQQQKTNMIDTCVLAYATPSQALNCILDNK